MAGLKLMAEVGLDGAGFERGLNKLGSSAAASVRNMAVSAFGIVSVEEAIRRTVERADELVNASKRLDTTVEQLQVMRQAAKDAGTEFGKIETALEKINIARQKALGTGDEAKKLLAEFGALGISRQMLKTQTAANLFQGPIAKTAQNRNVADISGPLKEILGKGFGDVLPVLRTDLTDLAAKMKKFGLIMDTETAVKLHALSDEFSMISGVIANIVGPALIKFTEWLIDVFTNSSIREGIDFLIRSRSGQENLPEFRATNGDIYSGAARAEIGQYMIDQTAQALRKRTPFSEFISTKRDDYISNALTDFHGNSYSDFSKYLNGLIQPVADVVKDAADKSTEDTNALKEGVKKFRENLQKQIDALNHPTVPAFTPDAASNLVSTSEKERRRHAATDALVSVGNFLGSSGPQVSSLAEKQVDLLTKIESNTRSLEKLMVPNGFRINDTSGTLVPL